MKTLCLRLLIPLVLCALWWVATRYEWVSAVLLPAPERVLEKAFVLMQSGELWSHLWASTRRVLLGFGCSALMAISLALINDARDGIAKALSPLLMGLQVIPPLSLMPLLILWLGIDEAPKLAIVILATFFPVYLSARAGLLAAHREYGELVQSLSLTRVQAYWHVWLPGAYAMTVNGLRIGFGYAWRALVSAELLAASSGLGYLIEDASTMMATDTVVVGIVTIALAGVVTQRVLTWLLTRSVPRGLRTREEAVW